MLSAEQIVELYTQRKKAAGPVKEQMMRIRDLANGDIVLPFISHGYEGFDINTADDWDMANKLISQGLAVLPEIVS